jgi:hypothetical protein
MFTTVTKSNVDNEKKHCNYIGKWRSIMTLILQLVLFALFTTYVLTTQQTGKMFVITLLLFGIASIVITLLGIKNIK